MDETGRPRPTKAMLLAAGYGERLRPLTESLPKCMVPIEGRPLLEYTVGWLRRLGVEDVIVNLHHAGERIVQTFGDGRAWGIHMTYSKEAEILGTAGGVRHAASFFSGPFFVWYADNLGTVRLDRMWDLHTAHSATATVALHRREDTSQSGVAQIDDDGRILRFVEKPSPGTEPSRWVSAGVMILEERVIDFIPPGDAPDLGRDILPQLLDAGEPVMGYRMSHDERLWWIDTPEDLREVRASFSIEAYGNGKGQGQG